MSRAHAARARSSNTVTAGQVMTVPLRESSGSTEREDMVAMAMLLSAVTRQVCDR